MPCDNSIVKPKVNLSSRFAVFCFIKNSYFFKRSLISSKRTSSLGVGAGASFVAMNMAASFALDEKKTAIYVDANMQDSFADQVLRSTSDYGLMDYLDDEA